MHTSFQHYTCSRRIKEHEPKVKITITMVSSRELTEEDFIGLPMTKENMDRYYAWKEIELPKESE